MPSHRLVNHEQFVLGVGALSLGAAFYALARPAASVDFLPHGLPLALSIPPGVAQWTGSLPSLMHTMAVCLLTASVAGAWRPRAGVVCSAWFVAEGVFELGQLEQISSWLRVHATSPSVSPYLYNYFLNGTFDPGDIALAAIGASLAVLIITHTRTEDPCDESA